MFKLFTKKREPFVSPISGTTMPISEVKDPVFSQKMIGDGFAIQPTSQKVYAPYSGTIRACFPTNHAVGLQTTEGIECLIHIGINTVELQGKYFTTFVKQGQTVQQGDLLIEFNLVTLQELEFDPSVILIFPHHKVELQKPIQTVNQLEPIALTLS